MDDPETYSNTDLPTNINIKVTDSYNLPKVDHDSNFNKYKNSNKQETKKYILDKSDDSEDYNKLDNDEFWDDVDNGETELIKKKSSKALMVVNVINANAKENANSRNSSKNNKQNKENTNLNNFMTESRKDIIYSSKPIELFDTLTEEIGTKYQNSNREEAADKVLVTDPNQNNNVKLIDEIKKKKSNNKLQEKIKNITTTTSIPKNKQRNLSQDASLITPAKPSKIKPLNNNNIISTNAKEIVIPKPNNKQKTSSVTPNTNKLEWVNSVYQREKDKDEKINRLREKVDKENSEREIEGCTFKPKINNKKIPNIRTMVNDKTVHIYDRQLKWNNQKCEKIEKEKTFYKLQENMECTFAPELLSKRPQFENNNITYNDVTTKKYFDRVTSAKKQKEEMNSRLNPDYNERYEKIVKQKQIKNEPKENFSFKEDEDFSSFCPKSEIKVDFGVAMKNLHSHLHSNDL